MKKSTKIIIIKQAMIRKFKTAFSAFMMKETLQDLPTLTVNGVKRINWSGCDL
ncbi:hypothetical protein [Marinomonas sp.]|uniref:hypothetical protein n=1 Tax=Marinomonas sp. TaxID=1904862 RepID=UPI003BACCF92